MFNLNLSLRSGTSLLLIGALSGMFPVTAAQPQPGTLATSVASLVPALSLPLYEVAHVAAQPRKAAQSQDTTPAATGAAPGPVASPHHTSKWVWVGIVAGAGVAIGAGLIAGSRQPEKTAAIAPTVTIAPGSGAIAGAP